MSMNGLLVMGTASLQPQFEEEVLVCFDAGEEANLQRNYLLKEMLCRVQSPSKGTQARKLIAHLHWLFAQDPVLVGM